MKDLQGKMIDASKSGLFDQVVIPEIIKLKYNKRPEFMYYKTGKEHNQDKEHTSGLDILSRHMRRYKEYIKKVMEEHTNRKIKAQHFSNVYAYMQNPQLDGSKVQEVIEALDTVYKRFSEEYIPQAMRDTLPYLLGAIKKDRLKNESELTIKKRELNKIKRRIRDAELINGSNCVKAQQLLTQAQQLGLVDNAICEANTLEQYRSILEVALEWSPEHVPYLNYDEIEDLLFKIEKLKYSKRTVDDEISSTYNFIKTGENYYGELEIQKNRLESIGLYEKIYKKSNCDEITLSSIPYIEQMQESLVKVNDELKSVERERPRLLKYLEDLNEKKENIIAQMEGCQSKIDALYEQEEILNKYKELNTRRGIVIGKIMLWIESINEVNPQSELMYELDQLERQVAKIESVLSQENIDDKIASILNRIGNSITTYARDLKLEHSDNPIRFDLRYLTILADHPDKSVPLEKMGGAANWVGYHLAVHLALHKHFMENNCPVPRFLFLDKPSYAYFPEELKSQQDISDDMILIEDRKAIEEVYNFIFDTVEKLEGKIQVIITGHAMLNDGKFSSCLKEIWRRGSTYEALIPKEWYE